VILHGCQVFGRDGSLSGTSERPHLQMEQATGALVDARGHGRVSLSQHGDELFTINHVLHGGAPLAS
jgi:hypothetical protein